MKITAKIAPEVYDISIVTDTDYPDKVEIHLLGKHGDILEGGQFDLDAFLQHIMEFYDRYY